VDKETVTGELITTSKTTGDKVSAGSFINHGLLDIEADPPDSKSDSQAQP
jgi:cation transport ATPase